MTILRRFASNEYIQTLTVIHPSSVISSNNPVAAKLTQNAQSHPAPKHHPQHQRINLKEKHSNGSSIGEKMIDFSISFINFFRSYM